MNLFGMMDALLRDREQLYKLAGQERSMVSRLLIIFSLSAAVYGGSMGLYRVFHPEFSLRSVEVKLPNNETLNGRVAGVNPETRMAFVYLENDVRRDSALELERSAPPTSNGWVEKLKNPLPAGARVRFNVPDPSPSYSLESWAQQDEYATLTLGTDAKFMEENTSRQPFLVALKVPLLFLLTLVVCAPALYVLNLICATRLHFGPVMTLLTFGLAATGVVLSVLAPIALLFGAVTENYHFMKIFHVLAFALAGLFGVWVLTEGLARMAGPDSKGKGPLLISWLLLYGMVGGQLAWTLKPFLGTPYLPATPPFRVEAGNIYVSFFDSLSILGKISVGVGAVMVGLLIVFLGVCMWLAYVVIKSITAPRKPSSSSRIQRFDSGTTPVAAAEGTLLE